MKPILRIPCFDFIKEQAELLIFDVRTGHNAFEEYQKEHIKGAIFVSLDKDLAEIGDFEKGGRHPLPSSLDFASTLGRLGITPDTHVVLYDDKSGSNAAARFWWMLKAFGHANVQVLDGGLQYAREQGVEMQSGTNQAPKSNYPAQNWKLPLVAIKDVEQASQDSSKVIIDVREAQRYNGITEPIDLVAGHILSAINRPFTENLMDDGRFRSSEDLYHMYAQLFQDYTADSMIVHCGSGVTACHSLLAMCDAGFSIPNLYVGSWSEWSRNNK